MTDYDENDSSTSADTSELSEPLDRWERICALAIGVICGGAGGYAVFEKSNQAGTATLLALAAIFLLIGVQGTPLIRFGSSSGSVELARIRRGAAEALRQAKEESSPERAEGIVEGVRLVAPDLVPKTFNDYIEYENSVASALSNMGYEVSQEVRVGQLRVDLKITNSDRTIYAEMKYYRRPVSLDAIHQAIGMASVLSAPVLLVANVELTHSARSLIGRNNVDFVQWRDESDNPALREATERALGNVN
jgi:Restriction endonuclease